jgi:hypothetical protein
MGASTLRDDVKNASRTRQAKDNASLESDYGATLAK